MFKCFFQIQVYSDYTKIINAFIITKESNKRALVCCVCVDKNQNGERISVQVLGGGRKQDQRDNEYRIVFNSAGLNFN